MSNRSMQAAARGFLMELPPRTLGQTVGTIMRGRNERVKDAIAEVAANSRSVWQYADWNAALAALEGCELTVTDWLLTV